MVGRARREKRGLTWVPLIFYAKRTHQRRPGCFSRGFPLEGGVEVPSPSGLGCEFSPVWPRSGSMGPTLTNLAVPAQHLGAWAAPGWAPGTRSVRQGSEVCLEIWVHRVECDGRVRGRPAGPGSGCRCPAWSSSRGKASFHAAFPVEMEGEDMKLEAVVHM